MTDTPTPTGAIRKWPPALHAILASMRFHDDRHMTCRVCGLVWQYGDAPQHTDACERGGARVELNGLLAEVAALEAESTRKSELAKTLDCEVRHLEAENARLTTKLVEAIAAGLYSYDCAIRGCKETVPCEGCRSDATTLLARVEAESRK